MTNILNNKLPTRLYDIVKKKIIKTDESNCNLIKSYWCLSYTWLHYYNFNKIINLNNFDINSPLGKTDWDIYIWNILLIMQKKYNFRYIWIDKICIIQNDENDKSNEIKNMGNYYKYAIKTLCIIPEISYTISSEKYNNIDYKLNIKSLSKEIYESYWCKRGWTLQEVLYSKYLIFASHDSEWNITDLKLYFNEKIGHIHDSFVEKLIIDNSIKRNEDKSLNDVLSIFKYRECKFLEDEIYIMAILLDIINNMNIEYKNEFEKLEKEFIKLLIELKKDFTFFSIIEYNKKESWIPNIKSKIYLKNVKVNINANINNKGLEMITNNDYVEEYWILPNFNPIKKGDEWIPPKYNTIKETKDIKISNINLSDIRAASDIINGRNTESSIYVNVLIKSKTGYTLCIVPNLDLLCEKLVLVDINGECVCGTLSILCYKKENNLLYRIGTGTFTTNEFIKINIETYYQDVIPKDGKLLNLYKKEKYGFTKFIKNLQNIIIT